MSQGGPPYKVIDERAAMNLLAEGEVEIVGRLPGASNYTLLTEIEDRSSDTTALAVYKPLRGEAPLWDFPEGTLCRREEAAYLTSKATGWNFVPPTLMREGPLGLGAFQLFIEHDPLVTAFDLADTHAEELRTIALFDLVVNNADRKAGHVLAGADKRLWAVDHGLCFHSEPKLRTVLWDFIGEPISSEHLKDLERLCDHVEGAFADRLEELLSAAEIDALRLRIESCLKQGRFPAPTGDRPYPWPPI